MHKFQNFVFRAIFPVFIVVSLLFPTCATVKTGEAAYGNLGKPSDPVPFMENVRRGKLPSGLTYYILENSRPQGRAYLTLAVHAGSVLEADDEQGLAHFTEHMAFNGTVRFPEAELINYLRSLGMRFGPEVNAYTTYDETVFGIEVPVETGPDGVKTIPARALAVIDDWTRAITFVPKDVDDERAVIMEEYRSRLSARERLMRKILPVIFEGSPYAGRYPIGLPEIIENAPAERLENFYKRWYRADNMAVILVGDFDGEALEASLTSHFLIPKPETPLARPEYDLPPPKKGNLTTLIHTDGELTYTSIYLYYKRTPKPIKADLADYRERMIDILVDHMLSLRFEEASLNPDSPYIGAGAGGLGYGKSSRYYILAAQAKTGSTGAALAELLKEKESMIRYGFTEAELAVAKTSFLSGLEQLVSEKNRQESSRYVSLFTNHFISGESLPDPEWELYAARELLPGISAADILAAVRDYFKHGDLRIFVSAAEAEAASLPSEREIRDMVRTSASMKIEPPAAAQVESGLLPEDIEPGKITAETTDGETGAVIWTLENGAKVILKETKNRNNEIAFNATAKGGLTSAAPDDFVSVRLAAEMAEISGLGPYSRPDLIKKLAGKQVTLGFHVSDITRGFDGFAASGDIRTLFEMLYLSFTRPRINRDAVAAMMDQYRTTLNRRNEDPNTVFSDEITRTTRGNSPWYKPLELADLPRVDPEKALAFLRRALNPADYTFVFVGNLDMETMRSCVETYLAPISRGEAFNSWQDPAIVRPGKIERKVYKGKEDKSFVYLGWFRDAPWSEESSIAAQILTEYLDIRMTEEIREKLGGVYSISVNASASPGPSSELSMGVYFACDPRRAEELSAAVTALLERTVSQPADRGIFDKSVEALQKTWEASVQNNAYIAQSYANSSVLLDTPLSRLDRRSELFRRIRPEEIRKLSGLILSDGPASVVLYPDNWKSQEN
ncbi:MAG: insulinase family protein [Treponema sp.]|jgi:zinc protease|nr:insulinase family protein [Treponema sp.]